MSSTTRVRVCGTHVPHRADTVGPYQGTKRPHASAIRVLLLYPNSTLTDVIPAWDRFIYPDMQYSLQVHLCAAWAELKAPPHSIRALCMVPPGDKPTSRKQAQVHMICTDTERRRETSPRT